MQDRAADDDWSDPSEAPLDGPLERFYRRAEAGRGGWLLAFAACAASLGVPAPSDLILAGLCTGAPFRTKRFILIAVAASVLGGTATYWTAGAIWENREVSAVVEKYAGFAGFTDHGLRNIHDDFVRHGWWSALSAGLRPVAYHRHAFTAGVFRHEEQFFPFLAGSLLSHLLRAFLVGGCAAFFGDLLRPITARRPWKTLIIVAVLWIGSVIWGAFSA